MAPKLRIFIDRTPSLASGDLIRRDVGIRVVIYYLPGTSRDGNTMSGTPPLTSGSQLVIIYRYQFIFRTKFILFE